MFNFQVFVSLALLVVVFGNPVEYEFVEQEPGVEFSPGVAHDCASLKPIRITPEEAAGEWFGVEMVRNVGLGKHHEEKKKPCLAGSSTFVNNTRYKFVQYTMDGDSSFEFDRTVFGNLDESTGRVHLDGDRNEEMLAIAHKDKKYITVAYCAKHDKLSYKPVTKIITFRYAGYPDIKQEDLKEMHDLIKSNLGIDKLFIGKLHCRSYGKN